MHRRALLAVLLNCLLLAFSQPSGAATVPTSFVDENLAPGVTFLNPTAIAFLPGGRLLVAEQRGRVYTLTNGVKSANPVWAREDEVLYDGDRGLLGLAVDPNYVSNHYLYFLYSVDPDTNGVDTSPSDNFGRISRYTVSFTDSTTVDYATRLVLMGTSWRQGPLDANNSHAVGALRFGRDGSLFFSAGDGASYNAADAGGLDAGDFGAGPDLSDPYDDIGAFRAQSLSNLSGKVMRINPLTGAGYTSNPYYDGNPYSVRSRVWAYGMRNPFRFTIRPATGVADPAAGNPGSVYIGDVGWNNWEEVNVVRTPGANFGWPCYEGIGSQSQYQTANPAHNDCGSMGTADNPVFQTSPTLAWDHSDAGIGTPPGFIGTCVIGGLFYTGANYPAQYRGGYFFSDFGSNWLKVATFDANDQLVSVVDFGTGLDGAVDFAADPASGDILYVAINTGVIRRIRYTGATGNAPPVAAAAGTPTFGTVPLTVNFSSTGTFDPEGDPFTLLWTFGDGPSSTAANPAHTYTAPGTYRAVLSADDGVGGIGRDTVVVVATTAGSFPSTPVLDNFNRANGALAAPWVDQPTGLSVDANALVSSGAYSATEWSGTTFGPNQEAYITVTTPAPTANEQDLMLKVQGATWESGNIEIWYSAPSAQVNVYTYSPAEGWVQRGVINGITYTAGQRFGARALADGTVQVYRDATLLGAVSVAGWPFVALGGRIGLSFTAAGAGSFDDFGGGNASLGVSTAPVVTVTSPNGTEAWTGGTDHAITWTATDDVGVTGVDVYYRDAPASAWTPLSLAQPNTGSFLWSVHNTPTTTARVRVVARDASSNTGADSSDANFTIARTPGGKVATTLRDFLQPGTQPLGAGTFQSHDACYSCHGGYNAAVEPGQTWRGTLMAQAARDPLFYACLAIAEQDAPSSGDLCIRCHAPMDWLSGRSQPTSGANLTAVGRDGVSCDFCHRLVDPIYKPGVSPVEDQAVLAGMLPAHIPTSRMNGQYVVDSDTRRRGPFADAVTPHPFVASAFHSSSDLCATCHDVSNPVFSHSGGAKYVAGPLDTPADSINIRAILPLERTYSEWKNSAFPAGVFAPEFAGNAPGGIVTTCQSCHMRDVTGQGCNYGTPPTRTDLPLHDMTGGNAWTGGVIASLYPGETDAAALAAGATRAVSMLQKAATIDVNMAPVGDSMRAVVVVTNHTGHKLPTGYPEGRRIWIQLVARNAGGTVIYQSGAYNAATGVLSRDARTRVYEAELGLSPAFAAQVGLPAGPSFHFALNDTLYKDNRIPPAGFTNAAFAAIGAAPVDPNGPTPRYPDGQNWDIARFMLPQSTNSVTATLCYQTTTKEYVESLKNDNVTNGAGTLLYNAWIANGRAAPVVMARDSINLQTLDAPGVALPKILALRALANPFHGRLDMVLALPQAAEVRIEILDVAGRSVRKLPSARMVAGEHRIGWDGKSSDGRAVNPGAYWASVWVNDRRLVRHVVALR